MKREIVIKINEYSCLRSLFARLVCFNFSTPTMNEWMSKLDSLTNRSSKVTFKSNNIFQQGVIKKFKVTRGIVSDKREQNFSLFYASFKMNASE